MTEKAKGKTSRAKTKAVEAPSVLTLEYSLAELPSVQHRAGLAGLVLMLEWLGRLPEEQRKGLCRQVHLDDTRLTIEIDEVGLGSLLDATYDAVERLEKYPSPWKNKAPVKEVVEEVQVKGKTKQKTFYLYPQVVPSGAWLADVEPNGDPDGPWIRLWRRMIWETMRGVPAQRAPFEERAQQRPTGLAEGIWKDLLRPEGHSVKLPSTYYIGAQAITADNVEFYDKARHQLLLHFWPFVAQVYIPTVVVPPEGKPEARPYAIVIPDVAMLEVFCKLLQDDLRGRTSALWGNSWPRAAIVDVPIESALHFEMRLRKQLASNQVGAESSEFVLGYEVHHVSKEGNNVRVSYSGRFEPKRSTVATYEALHDDFWDPSFRRIWLMNLVYDRPLHAGYEKFVATSPFKTMTIGSNRFCHDAKRFFDIAKANEADMHNSKQVEDSADELDPQEDAAKPKDNSIESIILDVVRGYVTRRLESKYKLVWKEAKNDPKKRQEYSEKREKLAKDAFLAVRSRPDNDFREYFAGTLCSVPQFLNDERYRELSRALRNEPSRVRTLTLLALSAAAYSSSPKSKES
jgi:CRISPR-associated protein Cmx8